MKISHLFRRNSNKNRAFDVYFAEYQDDGKFKFREIVKKDLVE